MDGRWLAFLGAGTAVAIGVTRSVQVKGQRSKTKGPKGSFVRVGPRLCKVTRQRYDDDVQIEQVLVLSTAHLSKFEAERLDRVFPERLVKKYQDVAVDEEKLETVLSFQTDYGWLVYARADEGIYDQMANGPDQMPVLANVLRLAASLDASWVRFDCDAGTVAGLDVFEW